MKNRAIILFTRIPAAGRTKTRLQPFLDGKSCCRLHRAFIKDIYNVIKKIDADVYVYCTAENNIKNSAGLFYDNPALFMQRGETLGQRMDNAISEVLDLGHGACVLIGTDVPLIGPENIENAFEILQYKDVVISPVEDGGYYLIGMKKSCKAVFSIEYGNSSVTENTIKAIEKTGKTYGLGMPTFDIDYKEDLLRLAEVLKEDYSISCKNTREELHNIIFYGGQNAGF